MNAQTLHCFSCGAAVRSDQPNCAHCGARLATISCPGCFGMMFQDAKFCPHCGGPAAVWSGEDSDRRCPGCEVSMLRGDIGGIPLHECGRCYGLWLDTPTFARICRDSEKQSVVSAGRPSLGTPNSVGPVRYVRCPQCASLMNRVNFANCSGVIVDVCRAHGTWFDHNELHRIVEFIREGGMDRSREKQKAEVAEAQRKLRSERIVSTPQPGSSSSSALSALDLGDVVVSAAELLTVFFD